MTVRLKTECPQCKRSLNVTDRHVGKNARCPACKHQWVIQKVSAREGPISEESSESKQSRTRKSNPKLPESKQPARQSGTQNKKLGRFEIIETLGSGSFGVVYKSIDPILGRSVALKIPKFDSTDVSRTRRFLTEAHAAARLKHPNIVAVYESGEVNSHPFIASEYVEGKPLSQIMKSSRLEFETSARLIRDLAEALAYAHKEGIVHRDIKPDNIMIADKNRPQIMDFGLAKLTDEDSQLTDDGNILGTPAYMSPEQARSRNDLVGPQSDQYSLGVVLYELLTRERPYTGPPLSILAQVGSEEESPEARMINKDIPSDLSAICHRAMQKEPEKRYVDCEDMAEDLSRWLSGIETKARPLSFLEKYRRWYGRNRKVARLWTALSMVLLTLLVIASVDYGWMKFGQDGSTEELKQAINEKLEAQRALAINEFERGRNFCEDGKLNEGLLWLANSLEKLTPEMSDLDSPIRNYIGSWLPYIHQLEFILPHDHPVNSLAISPDGKLLISGTRSKDIPRNFNRFDSNNLYGEGAVQFWNLETGKLHPRVVSHESGVSKVLFSPDGKYAVSAGLDKKLKIFNPNTGKEIHDPILHPHAVVGLAFNHDGTILVSTCMDEIVRLWNTTTWSLIKEFNIKDSDEQKSLLIRQIGFTPDSRYLMINNGNHDPPSVTVWDLTTDEEVSLKERFINPYISSFTPDGREIILNTEGDLRLLKKWDAPLDVGVMIKKHNFLEELAIARESGLLVSSGFHTPEAMVFDLNSGDRIGQVLLHEQLNSTVDVSRDGSIVATGAEDNLIKIWAVHEERQEGKLLLLNSRPFGYFFPKENRIISDDVNSFKDDEHRVNIWNLNNLTKEAGPFIEPGNQRTIDITEDGNFYIRSNWQGVTIRVVQTGEILHKINLPSGITASYLIEQDKTILTSSLDKKIRFWDVQTGKLKGDPVQMDGVPGAIRISSNERYLLVVIDNNQIELWDLKTKKVLSKTTNHPGSVWCVSFHPENKYFASGCRDGSVYFWSIPDSNPVKQPIYNYDIANGIRTAEFHPDGQNILVGGPSRGAQFWDLNTLLPSSRRMMNGSWSRQADLSPDGTKLLTVNFSEERVGEEVQIRSVVPRIDGTPSEIKNMLEKTIGLKLTEEGEIKVLDYEEWNSK